MKTGLIYLTKDVDGAVNAHVGILDVPADYELPQSKVKDFLSGCAKYNKFVMDPENKEAANKRISEFTSDTVVSYIFLGGKWVEYR